MVRDTLATEAPASPGADGPFDLPAAVEAELSAFVGTESAALRSLDPALAPLAEVARDAVLAGGKRIRPTFAYWGWRACGAEQPIHTVLPALAALELLHAFALVHDDVMDRSATRRGRPTAHRVLATMHADGRLRGDGDHFGDGAAILVGDLCLVWADRLMARSQVDPRVLTTARHTYDGMRVEAIAGQFLDILADSSEMWTVDQALRTARLKTAGYTVTRPLLFGAGLAGLPGIADRLAGAFVGYGAAVGEAFQLRDDLLGVFGEPSATGKPLGDDLAAAKPTVLLQLARTMASRDQVRALERLLRQAGRAAGAGRSVDVDPLAQIIRETGAADLVIRMIEDRVRDGKRALARAPLDPHARVALCELAESVAWRSA